MNRKNLLSGRDKELYELAEQYEKAQRERMPIYMDADDLADLADWYAMRNKFQTALETTEYGLSLHPNNTALLVERAYLFLDTQRRGKAKEIVERIPDDFSSEVKILKANILMGEGKLEEAEKLINTIKDKEELANIIEVAYLYNDMGYSQKASQWLEIGKGLYDEDEAYLAVVADCLYGERKFDEAAVYYNKLIDKNPYSAPYWFGLARCYFEQQQYDKAIDACDYAIISDDEFAEAYVVKGHSFYQLGNDKKALESYRKAEELQVLTHDFVYTFIAMGHISQNEWEQAYHYLKAAIDSYEEKTIPLAMLYSNAALCLFKMGEKEKAYQYSRKAIGTDPNDVENYLISGRIYMEDGNPEQGIKQWARALKIAPYPETWNEIGLICMEINQIEYARVAFEHVKKDAPDYEGINERLTSIYLILHDKENFMKYNQLCKKPISQDELKELQQMMNGEEREDMAKIMKDIFESLK